LQSTVRNLNWLFDVARLPFEAKLCLLPLLISLQRLWAYDVADVGFDSWRIRRFCLQAANLNNKSQKQS